jgi:hypothetical protein
VAGASGLRLTYTPDYAATFAVQRQAHRYHFSAAQRYVWWLLPILQLSVLLAVIVWDENIRSALSASNDCFLESAHRVCRYIGGDVVVRLPLARPKAHGRVG